MIIRPYAAADENAVWGIFEPVLRAAEAYALPSDWSRNEALDYWCSAEHQVFVADDGGDVVGTYYLQANRKGGGSHVANCGYMTSMRALGRGVARTMCAHSLDHAAMQGFRAMQFNFVVSTNTRAVALWRACGFDVVGTLPGAFQHPALGFVDALVTFRTLPNAIEP